MRDLLGVHDCRTAAHNHRCKCCSLDSAYKHVPRVLFQALHRVTCPVKDSFRNMELKKPYNWNEEVG